MTTKVISHAEMALHNNAESTWTAIHGKVYDLTKFLNEHPGGEEVILEWAGKDSSQAFDDVGHSKDARDMMVDYEIGTLEGGAAPAAKPKPAAAPAASSKPAVNVKDALNSSVWVDYLLPAAVGCLVFVAYKTLPKLMAAKA